MKTSRKPLPPTRRIAASIVALFAVMACGCTATDPGALSASDREAITQASRAYAEAWLSNEPDAVMATFVPDPVLSPSGMPYREGGGAARSFWWPAGGPPTTVTRFDTDELEVGGAGRVGYVRGTFVLEFEYEGASFTNRGKFLHLMTKTPGAGWRISHHLWDDFPAE